MFVSAHEAMFSSAQGAVVSSQKPPTSRTKTSLSHLEQVRSQDVSREYLCQIRAASLGNHSDRQVAPLLVTNGWVWAPKLSKETFWDEVS